MSKVEWLHIAETIKIKLLKAKTEFKTQHYILHYNDDITVLHHKGHSELSSQYLVKDKVYSSLNKMISVQLEMKSCT